MTRPIRVIPAVLTDDQNILTKMLHQVSTFTDYVQIDIMDGRFVPSHSISWEQLGKIPSTLCWEAHLMVQDPEKEFAGYQKMGARKLVFHYEAVTEPEKTIQAVRRLGTAVGLAVNPETPVSAFLSLTESLDSVLFLSVHPGFYGAKFIPEVLDKIGELRRARPDLEIGIDGGIKENNIAEISRSGVNDIFVGSAILLQPDPAEAHRKLLSIARSNYKG